MGAGKGEKHWITQYRERHGLSRAELAKKLTKLPDMVVSEVLLAILENRENAVTHPDIALHIAMYCKASREQLD